MSTQPETQQAPTPTTDPLSGLEPGQILRCRDETTGWTWYVEPVGGVARKYHECDGFEGRPADRQRVAETVAFESVDTATVSREHLAMVRGECE